MASERALFGVRTQVIVEIVELAKDELAALLVTLEQLQKPVCRRVTVLEDAKVPRAWSRSRAALLGLRPVREDFLEGFIGKVVSSLEHHVAAVQWQLVADVVTDLVALDPKPGWWLVWVLGLAGWLAWSFGLFFSCGELCWGIRGSCLLAAQLRYTTFCLRLFFLKFRLEVWLRFALFDLSKAKWRRDFDELCFIQDLVCDHLNLRGLRKLKVRCCYPTSFKEVTKVDRKSGQMHLRNRLF